MMVRAYSRYWVGLRPRVRCTYRLKYAGDENLNMSEISTNVSVLSRSIRAMSSEV